MRPRTLAPSVGTALAVVAITFAHGQANTPIERAEHLVGCWQVIKMPDDLKKKVNEIDIGAPAYEWFCFSQSGTMNTMGSSTPRSVTTRELREAFAALPADISFAVVQPGTVRTIQRSTGQTLTYATSFKGITSVLPDGSTIPKGALVMGFFDFNKNRPVYWRYLLRMPDER